MSAILHLLARQARDARESLIVAPLASAVVLVGVQAWFPGPVGVSEASAIAAGALAALWTLYFASDAFASDAASGRLATQALLPLSSGALWRARAGFAVVASLAQIAWTTAVAYALQLGSANASLEHFEATLASFVPWWPMLFVLASAAMLASLLVDGALAAMIGASLVLGGLALLATPAVRALAVVGVEVPFAGAGVQIAALAVAVFFLAVGAFAFARGQRRLGSRPLRALHVAWPLAALVGLGGLAAAAEYHRRTAVELENPRQRFLRASASRDGLWLALEAQFDLTGNDDPPPNVWLLDADGGAHEVLARSGMLVRDRLTYFALGWDAGEPLRVLDFDSLVLGNEGRKIEVRAGEPSCTVTSNAADVAREFDRGPTRLGSRWARIERIRRGDSGFTTVVRWIERGLEARFDGGFAETAPGRAVLPTPVVGRVLARRGERIVLHEIESASERVVFEGELRGLMQPSPSGSAVIVYAKDATHVLDGATGEPLHAPWPRERWHLQWVDSSDDARVLQLRASDVRDAPTVVLDLDTGASFEIERDFEHPLLCRLGSRGYVFVRRDGDLVWVDGAGARVRTLVDR